MTRCVAAFAVCCLLAPLALADWPQFLGPAGDATYDGPAAEAWPEDGLTELWQTKTGPGYGGPAVRDGVVYLCDRDAGEADVLRAIDLKTGEDLWSVRFEEPGRTPFPGSRCTPAVTDTHVFITSPFGKLHAIDLKTRQTTWSFDLLKHYNAEAPRFGYSYNPLVDGGVVIVGTAGQDVPGLVAFDVKTGEIAWESERFGGRHFFCSPMIRTIAGTRAVLMLSDVDAYFIDPAKGKTLWKSRVYAEGRTPIPNGTTLEDGQALYITNGYDNGSAMFDVKTEGDAVTLTERWRIDHGSQIHVPVVIDGHLYQNINENSNLKGRDRQGGLACIDVKTGEVRWQTKDQPNLNRGPVMHINDKLIALDADTGELFLIKPNPQKYEQLASFVALEPKSEKKNEAWAPMAITDGLLIVRDQGEMKCFDLRQGE